MTQMKKVTISLTDQEGKRVKEEAKSKGVSVSKLLRDRLEVFIVKHKNSL